MAFMCLNCNSLFRRFARCRWQSSQNHSIDRYMNYYFNHRHRFCFCSEQIYHSTSHMVIISCYLRVFIDQSTSKISRSVYAHYRFFIPLKSSPAIVILSSIAEFKRVRAIEWWQSKNTCRHSNDKSIQVNFQQHQHQKMKFFGSNLCAIYFQKKMCSTFFQVLTTINVDPA